MAVSKSLRFAVLTRDGYTCRYCGAKPQDVELHVDHVVPVALGGSDVPENLVAACAPCNSGKAATPPDAQLVADIDADALRWARAISAAAQGVVAASEQRESFLWYFEDEWRSRMPNVALGDDWDATAWTFHSRGLPLVEIDDAIAITSRATVPARARWRYFCGVGWNKLSDLERAARSLIDSGKVV